MDELTAELAETEELKQRMTRLMALVDTEAGVRVGRDGGGEGLVVKLVPFYCFFFGGKPPTNINYRNKLVLSTGKGWLQAALCFFSRVGGCFFKEPMEMETTFLFARICVGLDGACFSMSKAGQTNAERPFFSMRGIAYSKAVSRPVGE